MKMRMYFSLLAAIFLLHPASAHAIILFPSSPAVTDKPHDDVVGRFRKNASAVAIGPNHAITTRHQGGNVTNTTLEFGGTTYNGVEMFTFGSADIRLVRLETTLGDDANLTHYVPMYTKTDELGQVGVVGGYGQGRGSVLNNVLVGDYGYEWGLPDNNQTQRWGTNEIDDTDDNAVIGSFTSDLLIFDFSDPGGSDFFTASEAAAANRDSGGGFFIKDNGVWKVAGLFASVSRDDESWFRGNVPLDEDGDLTYLVRVSSYASDIQTSIPEPATALLLLSGLVAVGMRRRQVR